MEDLGRTFGEYGGADAAFAFAAVLERERYTALGDGHFTGQRLSDIIAPNDVPRNDSALSGTVTAYERV